MEATLLKALNEERAARRAALVITDLASGAQRLVREAGIDEETDAGHLRQILLSGKSRTEATDNGERFIEVHLPAAKFVIIGAVHISQALAPMAMATGFDVTVIDPRTAFATPSRPPADGRSERSADPPLSVFIRATQASLSSCSTMANLSALVSFSRLSRCRVKLNSVKSTSR